MPRLPRSTATRALTLAGALALSACAGARPPPTDPEAGGSGLSGLSDGAARATLERFAGAVEAGRWPEAWALLSVRWRAATTPERLAADYRGAGPVAREAAGRVTALLRDGATLDGAPGPGGGPLRLAVGAGRAARLVPEGGRWRVDALE